MHNKTTNFKIKNSQKGVSLIITLFIMIIILSVVLSISTLLYSEIKVLRNVGNSVIAFYAADSGVEKVLYYDRQAIPPGAARGICNICAKCSTTSSESAMNCNDCHVIPNSTNGCTKCTDCKITFGTTMSVDPKTSAPKRYYNEVINVSTAVREGTCPFSTVYVNSGGTYTDAKRAINLTVTGEVKTIIGPGVSDNGTKIKITGSGNNVLHLAVVAPEGLTVKAYIYYSPSENGTFNVVSGSPVTLGWNSGQSNYKGNYNAGVVGYFLVSVGGVDANGTCTSIVNE